MISAIHNLSANYLAYKKATQKFRDDIQPVISYNLCGDRIALNDWDNPNFFPMAFPILFPYGNRGHFATWFIKISLQTWANWAISYHSKQFAWHPFIMSVVYDILQQWSASQGYSLLVKSKHWNETETLIFHISYKQLCEAAKAVRSMNTSNNSDILALKHQVQLVAIYILYSFIKCFQYRLYLQALIVTRGMCHLWITFNLSDLRCSIVF